MGAYYNDEALARQLQAEEHQAMKLQQNTLFRSEEDRQLATLQSYLRLGCAQVALYEDELLQALAFSSIPEHLLSTLEDHISQEQCARNLLSWFKSEFFTWVNNPECEQCGCKDTKIQATTSAGTPEEVEGQAGVVEVYICASCGSLTRFPRYNNPGKLLETRRGRCGEWANCFTLICRSAGLEVRWVRDWTDHVWTEYYSTVETRWIHLDPCENAYDQPHLYDAGWGKKLSYVIGFHRCGVTDISARYSVDKIAMAERQLQVANPSGVKSLCVHISWHMRQLLPPSEQEVWVTRETDESKQLSAAAFPQIVELPGRQTGSASWRAERGELGNQKGPSRKLGPDFSNEADLPAPSTIAASAPKEDLLQGIESLQIICAQPDDTKFQTAGAKLDNNLPPSPEASRRTPDRKQNIL